jgi:hypothetical protein
MYKIATQCMILWLVVCFCWSNTQAAEITLNNTPAQVYFCPSDNCTGAIVNTKNLVYGLKEHQHKISPHLIIFKKVGYNL